MISNFTDFLNLKLLAPVFTARADAKIAHHGIKIAHQMIYQRCRLQNLTAMVQLL
jgi:hypothetical protein